MNKSMGHKAQEAGEFLPFTRPCIDEETVAAAVEVLKSGWITTGPKAKEFEGALSGLFDGRPVRVFNSGTGTMEVGLRVMGVGEGDEVITTPLTWVATSNVILATGAKPVFVDADPVTRNMDLSKLEAAVTARTRVVMPVDLAGLPVDRGELYAIAKRKNLRVLEDAAQAMGSVWGGKLIGAQGDMASFSFHPNKNITSIEGGALVLNNEEEARLAEQYRLQGIVRSGFDGMEMEVVGGKFNLTDVAAAVGLGQLKRLEEFNGRRRELARRYFELFEKAGLAELGVGLPVKDFAGSNWHMFQVELPLERMGTTRAAVMEKLKEAGIGTGAHYPALHLFKYYQRLGWKAGDFPNAERLGRSLLTLPLFPSMKDGDVDRVVGELMKVMKGFLKK